jgi:hypothetical protein
VTGASFGAHLYGKSTLPEYGIIIPNEKNYGLTGGYYKVYAGNKLIGGFSYPVADKSLKNYGTGKNANQICGIGKDKRTDRFRIPSFQNE